MTSTEVQRRLICAPDFFLKKRRHCYTPHKVLTQFDEPSALDASAMRLNQAWEKGLVLRAGHRGPYSDV